MSEELFTSSLILGEYTELSIGDFETNTRWANTGITSSTELAPDGRQCSSFTNTSSVTFDIRNLVNADELSIGLWVKPSTYLNATQSGYANQAVAFHLGTQFSNLVNFVSAPGVGPIVGYNAIPGISNDKNTVSQTGVWTHLLLSLSLVSGVCRGFTNGQQFCFGTRPLVSDWFNLWLGGFANRSGYSGATSGRYPYRGLMSDVRIYPKLIIDDFET